MDIISAQYVQTCRLRRGAIKREKEVNSTRLLLYSVWQAKEREKQRSCTSVT